MMKVKKKTRRLKKTVRKTLGTLFLISALIVAAIPVENLQAYDANGDPILPLIVTDNGSNIPTVGPSDKIYTTGDGRFQFAYVNAPGNPTEKIAVIVGYSQVGSLQGDTLTIPDTVDVYDKFTDTNGTYRGYAAVNGDGDFLYYNKPDIQYGPDGAETGRTDHFYVCYYDTYNDWGSIASSSLYIKTNPAGSDTDTSAFTQTVNPSQWRLSQITVAYIGNQRVVQSAVSGNNQDWTVENVNSTSKNGVFSGNGSIIHLVVGENLQGIGNYAFYNCTAMQSITLGNGLTTIGNGAFENCVNIKDINLQPNSNIQTIGDHAFYNCTGLTSFNMPINVLRVGDYAFAGCTALETIDLDGYEGQLQNVVLQEIGRGVFRGCRSLKGVAFHENWTADLPASIFEGCTSLGYITFPGGNANLTFSPAGGGTDSHNLTFTMEDFKNTVPESFYFESISDGDTHDLCRANGFAFKYYGQDIYEIILTDGASGSAMFQVNSSNQLIQCVINGMKDIPIPGTIGPYQITEIYSSSFQNNADLERITIPSSITVIGADAFKGCYKLEEVIFEEPINITTIGSNAFQTQDVLPGLEGALSQTPRLTFTGTISPDSVPFQYAMDPSSNINKGTQPVTYIEYYSGWPTNLVVQYNPSTDSNELINYPTMKDLDSYTVDSFPYATAELAQTAKNAANKFIRDNNGTDYTLDAGIQSEAITQDEQAILDAVLSLRIPNGVESVKDQLFKGKEADDLNWAKDHWKNLDWNNMTSDQMPLQKSITTEGLAEIPAQMFEGCVNLTSVSILGNTTKIGDYAFDGCTYLSSVTISPTVSEMGLRPFRGCSQLIDVDFQGSPNFTCERSIIYGLTDGVKSSIVQCLESRGNGRVNGSYNGKVDAVELAGVTSVANEAFMDAANVTSIDFSDSRITRVPPYAFAETSNLYSVTLPATVQSIAEHAFLNSGVQAVYIPGSVSYIDNTAFGDDNGENISSNLTIYCPDDSVAAIFADEKGIDHQPYSGQEVFTVTFWMNNYSTGIGEVIRQDSVIAGDDVALPTTEDYPQLIQEGYRFIGWSEDGRNIQAPTDIWAQYEVIDPNAEKLTVEFYDINNQLIESVLVDAGGDATSLAPNAAEMAVPGYSFTGWRPAINNITENTKTYAQYTALGETEYVVNFYDWNGTLLYTQTVAAGGSAITPQNPVREGYTFTGWMPGITNIQKDTDVYAQYERNDGSSGNGNNNNNNNGSGNNNNGNAVYYTLTVRNGSGSGSYVAGSQPIIIANDPASGQEFSNWTVEPSDVTIASTAVSATVITMPEKNVTVTANYRTAGSGTTTTGSGNSAGSSSSNRPNNTTGTVSNGGTTIVIDKNGLSNTGVASATVNGSSDDFVIKITESTEATEAAVRALMAEYGDLTNIKYFPMDISLYDSTGTQKITDTTGLSITITLPLPDSLITYAGNNMIAGVVDDRLDKLTPRFTTISGVSCITFTAEHFSPYVIYVDTSDLSAGTVADNTPQTGDGIHPKWFLSVGLASLSFMFFMKRDRKKLKRAMA